jgi:ferredoxin
MITMQKELLKQLFKRAFTNKFPAKHIPGSVSGFLERVGKGEARINPPVPTPEGFRGRVKYDEKNCIRCKQCTKVCPANAVVFDKKEKVIRYHLFRCTFCGECVAVCPAKALTFTKEFLLSDYNKF